MDKIKVGGHFFPEVVLTVMTDKCMIIFLLLCFLIIVAGLRYPLSESIL
jgi:hypothetical protein